MVISYCTLQYIDIKQNTAKPYSKYDKHITNM